jgi:hypothetical protein
MQCQAITKRGTQCTRPAQSGASHCAQHLPQTAPKKSKKKTAASRSKQPTCPKCGSTSGKSFFMLHKEGIRPGSSAAFITTSGNVGVGYSSPSMTATAKETAPPGSFWDDFFEDLKIVFYIGIFFAVILGGGSRLLGNPSETVLAILACISFGFPLGIYLVIFFAQDFKREKRAKQREEENWENSYQCARCGTQYVWQ